MWFTDLSGVLYPSDTCNGNADNIIHTYINHLHYQYEESCYAVLATFYRLYNVGQAMWLSIRPMPSFTSFEDLWLILLLCSCCNCLALKALRFSDWLLALFIFSDLSNLFHSILLANSNTVVKRFVSFINDNLHKVIWKAEGTTCTKGGLTPPPPQLLTVIKWVTSLLLHGEPPTP